MATFPLSRLDHPAHWLFTVLGIVVFSGCATTPNFSALEDDEMYLRRGEEFITDAQYLNFALEQSAEEPLEDDYYDPSRSLYSPGYAGGYGYGMPRYQSSINNPYRPFGNGMGNGWGLSSYLNPFGAGGMGYGMGFGMGYGGMDPYGSGWGNPYGMGYGSGYGYGYSPFAANNWNNGYGGYNGWNNGYGGWNNSNGGWSGTGSNDSFNGVTGRTRTPIMSYTGSGSNYDSNGVLVRPKVEETPADQSPTASPRGGDTSAPTYVAPASNSRMNRWMEKIGNQRDTTSPRPNRSWSAPEPSNNSSRSRTSPANTPSRSSGSSGGSRPSGSSRSSRGGGR